MTFAVIGCSDCTQYWVTTHDHAVNPTTTTECPGCGAQYTGGRRPLATASTRDAACEKRGQLLAEKAGYGAEYQNNPSYAEAGVEVCDKPFAESAFENESSNTFKSHREKLDEYVDLHPIGKNAFGNEISKDPVWTQAFQAEAEAILGTVGQNELTSHGTSDTELKPYSSPSIQVKENKATIVEINDTKPYSNIGITPTQQRKADTPSISAHQPITEVWREVVTQPRIQSYFISAAQTIADSTHDHLETVLNTAGILNTPLNGHGTRNLFHEIRRRDSESAAWELLRILHELGTGHSTVEDIHAAARLFQFADPNKTGKDIAPTIALEINHDEFRSLSRTQRTDVCELIGTLSKAFEIRIIATRVTQAYLRQHHREHLPGVSEWGDTHRPDCQVDDVLASLNPDGVPVSILRLLNDQPGETLSYHEVYANLEISPSRARQCISTLKDHGLVETFNPDSAKRLSLLISGRDILKHINEHFGRQTTLENAVSGTPKTSQQRRVTRSAPDGHCTDTSTTPPTETATESAQPYQTSYLSHANHAAIAASGGGDGTVTVMNDGIADVDSNTRFVSVDQDRSEAVVSVHATNPLDYTVSIAVALSSPELVDVALDERTLNTVLDDVPSEILRNARQIGYLTEEVLEDAGSFRDMLVRWGENIETMTWRLNHGEYDDRAEFVGEILRDAHGLAGSIVHLLDEVGVDLVRDIRVPAGLNTVKVESLAESIAHSVLIQSRYESHVAYRQLFEDRDDKRDSAFGVEVDAADPFGVVIGSFVLRGGSAERVSCVLESELRDCVPHEDAPEFGVLLSMRSVTRQVIAETATRVLSPKNLRVTRQIVSVLDALVDSPFGVARALQQLGAVESPREMEAVELRFALRQLSSSAVLSKLPRSVGEILMVLVDADRVLSQGEVADRAGVSTQTVRNHADVLTATGMACRNERGWRFAVSFRLERGSNVMPETCSEAGRIVVDGDSTVVRRESSRCSGRGEPVSSTMGGNECQVGWWCSVGTVLCRGPNGGSDQHDGFVRQVIIGKTPRQESIAEYQ